VRGGGDDPIFENVAGLEAEDANGFDADVLVGGGVDDGGIGIVSDGAGENVGGAAAGMRDVNERDFYRFEGAVVVEIEAGELADAEFVVDVHPGVDFFAGIAVGFKAGASFEEFDLSRVFWFLGQNRLFEFFVSRLLGGLLRLRKNNDDKKRTPRECAQEPTEDEMKLHDGLGGSLGRGLRRVKRRVSWRCRICTREAGSGGTLRILHRRRRERRVHGEQRLQKTWAKRVRKRLRLLNESHKAPVSGGGLFRWVQISNNTININELRG